MLKTITCNHCKSKVAENPRLKVEQKYCGKPGCQAARKTEWYRKKIAVSPEYSNNQKESKRKWRREKPSHEYQRRYRERHPEYVKKNRQQQQERNRRRRLKEKENESKKIVKIDALGINSIKTRIYRMRPMKMDSEGKIVKIDTLYVELKQIKGLRAVERLIGI